MLRTDKRPHDQIINGTDRQFGIDIQESDEQRERSLEIMKHNLAEHDDWIVLNNTMQVLFDWSRDDSDLANWLKPHLQRLEKDSRKSVAGRARKLLARLS